MFCGTSKKSCNKISKLSKLKVKKRVNKLKTKCGKATTQPQVKLTNDRVTLPYNVFGEGVTAVTVNKKDNAEQGDMPNEDERSVLQNPQASEEQTHFKSISDYYLNLEARKPSQSSSIFKEIDLRFQGVSSQLCDNFCKSLKQLTGLRKIRKSKFMSSIAKIKKLVNDANNNSVEDEIKEFQVFENKTNFQCNKTTFRNRSERCITSTPNRPIQLPVIESTIYEPYILTKNNFTTSLIEKHKKLPLPSLSLLNNKEPFTFTNQNQFTHSDNQTLFNNMKRRQKTSNSKPKRQNRNIISTRLCFDNFNTVESNDDLILKLDESLLSPKVPELKDPSPLKFYPRRIIIADS